MMHVWNKNISEGTNDINFKTYSEELGNMDVQTIPEEGIKSSPKNKNPPPRALKQWPTTLWIRPKEWSWDKMLALPFPRPRTPDVAGGELEPEYFWSYPHLAIHQTKKLLIILKDEWKTLAPSWSHGNFFPVSRSILSCCSIYWSITSPYFFFTSQLQYKLSN